VLVYAKEYFAYFTIYQMQEYKFPVPLGTKSVVNALHKIAAPHAVPVLQQSPESPQAPITTKLG
jgi:hypothetical protein